jgi:hypothetical protein
MRQNWWWTISCTQCVGEAKPTGIPQQGGYSTRTTKSKRLKQPTLQIIS